jgi:hypothetical protein
MSTPYRFEDEPTPEGRLAAVARAEMYRHIRMWRAHPPDYADILAALEIPVKTEILAAKLEEAQLKPCNSARVLELIRQMQELVVQSIRK